jgi:acetoin utilization deacetylase AcuC-like enzyme
VRTGFCWHELYAWHDTGHAVISRWTGAGHEPENHVESAESKRRLRNLLDVSGVLDQLAPIRPRPATASELGRFHTPAYVDRIRRLSAESGGDAGERTPFGRGSYEIACLAAGGVMECVDAVLDGRIDNAYALVRPPGHHAERDRGRGFCIFNNVAVAALHARESRGVGRIAIVDWDVHHGNGTQQAFWADPDTLFISLHQAGLYPVDSGWIDERGGGDAFGTVINVPLPPGSGRGAYLGAVERVVVPALERFRPELLLVSSGFDGGSYDPLGRMILSGTSFRAMTARLMACGARMGNGRIVMAHEGGYSTAHVPFCGLAVVEELSGIDSGLKNEFDPRLEQLPYQDLQAHQDAVIASVEPYVGDVP